MLTGKKGDLLKGGHSIKNITNNDQCPFFISYFQENNIKSPLSDNHSNNITSHDNKEAVFTTSKPLVRLEPSTKMELAIKTEPMDVKPVKVALPQKPLPIQLPRLQPKPPPVVIVSPQVCHFLFCNCKLFALRLECLLYFIIIHWISH